MVRPTIEANGTGVLHRSPFGLVMPITLLYVGIAILAADLRDAEDHASGAEGTLFWTRKGSIFQYVLWGAIALTLIGWYIYVRWVGLNPF